MIPDWLHWLSIISLLAGGISALVVALDLRKHPQHMWIMNVVWPLVALFAHVLALWAYFRVGRLAEYAKAHAAMEKGETPPHKARTSFATKVGKGASHCGAGCTLGDICAEWLVVLVPVIAVWFGYESIFQEKIFAVWIVDYIFAFGFGVAFQYFTIKPMRGLSPTQGLIQAVKADTLSLTAWQVGMYGFMAVAHFWIFGELLDTKLHTTSVEFWFMMQIAMLCGFVTAYPVNWWLIRRGVKEAM
ncbi:DUF4396 domain-containing protein [Aquicoccus sp. SCR17]|nr:DUF4396 domain-containing protein [Carideicomes alvinocaridis]